MRFRNGLVAGALLCLIAAGTPAMAQVSTPVIAALTATGSTPTFLPFKPAIGSPAIFNVSIWGTFVATEQLERSFDNGATWLPITAAGTQLYVWSGPASEQAVETEYGVQYRVRATSYTSGTINVRISQ